VRPDLISALLKPGIEPDRIEERIWSVLPPADRAASYDPMARAYDLLIGNTVYNKLVWGNWSALYRDVAIDAVKEIGAGPVLDCGCGSLIFTAPAYHDARLDHMILFDRSLGMMRRGADRLPGGLFLQGDALNLPFSDASFGVCLSWGLAHIFGSASPLFSELQRVTVPGGRVSASMLVLAGRNPGDWVLPKLHHSGEIARPERPENYQQAFNAFFERVTAEVRGNMLFLNGFKRSEGGAAPQGLGLSRRAQSADT
jgi:ubiquinone/menaquinone biosynthesis C-methylase UbiE